LVPPVAILVLATALSSRASAQTTSTDDDTATIQAMLDEGGRVHLPSGQYRVTSPLMIDSGTRVEGDGNSTVIMGDFDGPILASRSYWDPDTAKELTGHVHIKDLSIVGGNDGTKQHNHGIVLRDFYSTVENVEIRDVGGHGIYMTASRRDGSRSDGTLVENRLINVVVRGSHRTSFFLGERGRPQLTDGYLHACVSQARHPIDAHLEIGSAAGWRIVDFHGYGKAVTKDAIVLVGGFRTKVHGLHVQNFARRGLFLPNAQESIFLDAISIDSDANEKGSHALYVGRSSGRAPIVYLNGLSITKDSGANSIAWAYVAEGASLIAPGGVALHGSAKDLVTDMEGKGTAGTGEESLSR
jgi:hypothetical protein